MVSFKNQNKNYSVPRFSDYFTMSTFLLYFFFKYIIQDGCVICLYEKKNKAKLIRASIIKEIVSTHQLYLIYIYMIQVIIQCLNYEMTI